jgi:hypothetical protein
MSIPHRSLGAVQTGERPPFLTGVRANMAFYSFNEQVGRPAVLLHVGLLGFSIGVRFAAAFHRRASEFEARATDVLCLVDAANPHLSAYMAAPLATPHVVFCPPQVLRPWRFDPREPVVIVIDRNTRVIASIASTDPDAAVEAALVALATCPIEPPRDESMPAPVAAAFSAIATIPRRPSLTDSSRCRSISTAASMTAVISYSPNITTIATNRASAPRSSSRRPCCTKPRRFSKARATAADLRADAEAEWRRRAAI